VPEAEIVSSARTTEVYAGHESAQHTSKAFHCESVARHENASNKDTNFLVTVGDTG
jgi:hypothetical protein